MPINIDEHAGFNSPERQERIVQLIADSNLLLQNIPMKDITSDRYVWWQETSLDTSVGPRAINSNFNEGSAKFNEQTANLKIYGSTLQVDRHLLETDNGNQAAAKMDAKIKSTLFRITNDMIHGDPSTTPEEMNGMFRLIAEGNNFYTGLGNYPLIHSGIAGITTAQLNRAVGFGVNNAAAGVIVTASAANRALLVEAIDRAIERGPGQFDMMIMPGRVKQIIKQAMRESGSMLESVERWGIPLESYGNIPIVVLPKFPDGGSIMDFNELSPDGATSSACASILLVKFGMEEYYYAVRKNDFQVMPFEKVSGTVFYQGEVEVKLNQIVARPDSVIRIGGIRLV